MFRKTISVCSVEMTNTASLLEPDFLADVRAAPLQPTNLDDTLQQKKLPDE